MAWRINLWMKNYSSAIKHCANERVEKQYFRNECDWEKKWVKNKRNKNKKKMCATELKCLVFFRWQWPWNFLKLDYFLGKQKTFCAHLKPSTAPYVEIKWIIIIVTGVTIVRVKMLNFWPAVLHGILNEKKISKINNFVNICIFRSQKSIIFQQKPIIINKLFVFLHSSVEKYEYRTILRNCHCFYEKKNCFWQWDSVPINTSSTHTKMIKIDLNEKTKK